MRQVNRTIALTAFFLLVILASACSSSKPSEADGRELFENKAKQEGSFKVKSFKKTNGIEEGQEYYALEFEAELECLTDGHTILIHYPCAIWCKEVGQINNFKGSMTFQKTEKGWRISKCDQRR